MGVVAIIVAVSCAGGKKLSQVKENGMTVQVAVGSLDDVMSVPQISDENNTVEVVEVDDLQRNRIIMNAVKDEETGETNPQTSLDSENVTER